MAGRIRSIKPEILDDDNTASLSDRAFRLMIAGICLADDLGNLRAGVEYLRAQVWFKERHRKLRPVEVEAAKKELVDCGIWEPYVASAQQYAHFRSWSKHQRTDNGAKQRVPTPDQADPGTYRPFRREPPPDAADRGGSPLDLRPPTSDHLPPTATPAGAREPGTGAEAAAPHVPATASPPAPGVEAETPREEARPTTAAKWRQLDGSDFERLWWDVLTKTAGFKERWTSLAERISRAATAFHPPVAPELYARQLIAALPPLIAYYPTIGWNAPTLTVRAFEENFERLEDWVAGKKPQAGDRQHGGKAAPGRNHADRASTVPTERETAERNPLVAAAARKLAEQKGLS